MQTLSLPGTTLGPTSTTPDNTPTPTTGKLICVQSLKCPPFARFSAFMGLLTIISLLSLLTLYAYAWQVICLILTAKVVRKKNSYPWQS